LAELLFPQLIIISAKTRKPNFFEKIMTKAMGCHSQAFIGFAPSAHFSSQWSIRRGKEHYLEFPLKTSCRAKKNQFLSVLCGQTFVVLMWLKKKIVRYPVLAKRYFFSIGVLFRWKKSGMDLMTQFSSCSLCLNIPPRYWREKNHPPICFGEKLPYFHNLRFHIGQKNRKKHDLWSKPCGLHHGFL